MNNVYFSSNGFTSTEGNYLCNIAKELTEGINERLEKVEFYNTEIQAIGSSQKQLLSKGTESLSNISLDLQAISDLNSFCAWVREAIKEKENEYNRVSDITLSEWAELFNVTMPECPKFPKAPSPINEDDVMNTWDINKRCKYLRLEAFAATFGKYIHPRGAYNEARKKAHTAINNPITKEGSGRDTILFTTNMSVPIEEVDNTFLQLQNTYRGYEKELNSMKAELKEAVMEHSRKSWEIQRQNLENYEVLRDEFNTKTAGLTAQYGTWKTNELERISKLKITVPDSLKSIFKKIKEAGDASK